MKDIFFPGKEIFKCETWSPHYLFSIRHNILQNLQINQPVQMFRNYCYFSVKSLKGFSKLKTNLELFSSFRSFTGVILETSKNTSLAAKGALAHRLQRHTACNPTPPSKFKMAAKGPQSGRRGLERCLSPGFWPF